MPTLSLGIALAKREGSGAGPLAGFHAGRGRQIWLKRRPAAKRVVRPIKTVVVGVVVPLGHPMPDTGIVTPQG